MLFVTSSTPKMPNVPECLQRPRSLHGILQLSLQQGRVIPEGDFTMTFDAWLVDNNNFFVPHNTIPAKRARHAPSQQTTTIHPDTWRSHNAVRPPSVRIQSNPRGGRSRRQHPRAAPAATVRASSQLTSSRSRYRRRRRDAHVLSSTAGAKREVD